MCTGSTVKVIVNSFLWSKRIQSDSLKTNFDIWQLSKWQIRPFDPITCQNVTDFEDLLSIWLKTQLPQSILTLTFPQVLIWIIHMFLIVNHWMESLIHTRLIWKIMSRFLYVIRVFCSDDFPLKYAIVQRTKHMALGITDDVTVINMWCFYIYWTIRTINLYSQEGRNETIRSNIF